MPIVLSFLFFMLCGLCAPAQAAGDLDEDMAAFKKDLLEVNKRLLLMEEALLFPADTRVSVFVSLDVGRFFTPDSVTLKMNDKTLTSHLYTDREIRALKTGAIQKLHTFNVKAGEHSITAFVSGNGPNDRRYRRAVSLTFEKQQGIHFVQLKMVDNETSQQPDFVFKDWRQ